MKTTNPSLPRMGLGMAALGRPGYINLDRSAIFGDKNRSVQAMQEQANRVMDRLFTLQGHQGPSAPWLDCARSYGLSEEFVGKYLRSNQVNRDSVFVSSKWGYTYVADWKVQLNDRDAKHEVKDHSTQNFLKQLKETESHLGEYINLYQIHSATFDSGILTDSRAHQALSECRRDKGWALGLSVSGPDQDEIIRAAMKIPVLDDDSRLFDSVQCTYNVLEQRPAAALQEASDAGMDIIIKEGLANGRILKNPKMHKFASRLGCEVDQLALGFILAQPFEARVLSGAVTAEQLESNFQAFTVAEQLRQDKELLQEISEACMVDSREYWTERAALAWN